MVDVAAAVEVDERLQGDLRGGVGSGGGGGELLGEVVVRGYVGLVMLAVVELHDLARDGGLEGAIVICRIIKPWIEGFSSTGGKWIYMVNLEGWLCRG